MTAGDAELLRSAWDAFSRGDVDAAVAALDPQVRWHGVDDPDGVGGCRSREDAADFIRGALEEGVTSELLDIRDAGDRLVAVIRMHAPPEWEQCPEPHGEVVTVRDGRVTEMVVYPTVEEALVAAGLAAEC